MFASNETTRMLHEFLWITGQQSFTNCEMLSLLRIAISSEIKLDACFHNSYEPFKRRQLTYFSTNQWVYIIREGETPHCTNISTKTQGTPWFSSLRLGTYLMSGLPSHESLEIIGFFLHIQYMTLTCCKAFILSNAKLTLEGEKNLTDSARTHIQGFVLARFDLFLKSGRLFV